MEQIAKFGNFLGRLIGALVLLAILFSPVALLQNNENDTDLFGYILWGFFGFIWAAATTSASSEIKKIDNDSYITDGDLRTRAEAVQVASYSTIYIIVLSILCSAVLYFR